MSSLEETKPEKCPKCGGDDVYYNSIDNICFCSECEFRWLVKEDTIPPK
jgi:DNA-directed RNA polymerase subunit RPC12/RpoP